MSALRCLRDAGCATEADTTYCCVEALCDPVFGCTGGQCDAELAALGTCATTDIDRGVCDEAYFECFPR